MEQSSPPRYIQVPIPEDLVEEVFAFVTERRLGCAGSDASSQPAKPTPPAPAPDTSGPEAIQRAECEQDEWDADALWKFLDGSNSKLNRLLLYLADRAPDYVPADEALVAARLTPGRSAGGFLSRVGRSCRFHFGRELPLGKKWNADHGRYDYRVSEEHADVILRHERE